jgi:hypothetical protein
MAITGSPTAMSSAEFSSMLRSAVASANIGASFTSVTLMVTAMDALLLCASESSVAVTVTM